MEFQQRQDTKVQFNPTAKLRMYQMPNGEDREAAWYSREDFLQFRRERAENIQLIRKLGIQEAEKHSVTSIGVMGNLNSNMRHVRELRRDSKLFQVLREQQRQHKQGICDPEAIAASCKHISFASSMEAQTEAQRVQDSSFDVYAEDLLTAMSAYSNKLSSFTRKRTLSIAEQPPSIPMRNVRRSATAA